jgi:hypothetical protein
MWQELFGQRTDNRPWLNRCRRLNTIFDRTKDHLVAFVQIAFVSILSRRLKRLLTEEVSA